MHPPLQDLSVSTIPVVSAQDLKIAAIAGQALGLRPWCARCNLQLLLSSRSAQDLGIATGGHWSRTRCGHTGIENKQEMPLSI